MQDKGKNGMIGQYIRKDLSAPDLNSINGRESFRNDIFRSLVCRGILIIGSYPPPFGGISRHVSDLQNKIRNDANIKAIVLNTEFKKRNVPGVICSRGRLEFIFNLFSESRRYDFAHLHTNGHNTGSWQMIVLGAIASMASGTPYFLTLHSGNCSAYIRGVNPYKKKYFLWALKKYQGIISVNDHIKSCLMEMGLSNPVLTIPAYLGLKIPPSKMDGGEIGGFINIKKPIISSVVAFRPEYRIEDLISVVRSLKPDFPDIGMVIIGAGPGKREINLHIEREGMKNEILVISDIDPEHVHSIMNASSVFIRSTAFDGDSISVREALSLKVPIVATDTGFRPEGVMKYAVGDVQMLYTLVKRILTGPVRELYKKEDPEPENLSAIMNFYKYALTRKIMGLEKGDHE